MNGTRAKIDPRLRGEAAQKRVATMQERATRTIHAFVEVVDRATRAELERLAAQPNSWIRRFVHLVEGYCTASFLENRLEYLAALPGVAEIEGVRYARPHLDRSVPSIHGWDAMSEAQRLGQGSGVVVAVIDYGLDFWMDDFREADGSTRVEFLWDQQLDPPAAGEKPPAKYGYGVEYSKAQIDAELRGEVRRGTIRHDPLHPEANIRGHGTHVTGIAAGNGRSGGGYIGVAPAARIVFVNLPRSTIVDQVNNPLGSLANSINLAHAIVYCFEKAVALNMPCVINLSMGFLGGGHDGDMVVECVIDAMLAQAGRAVVIAAGNEHAPYKKVHYGARLKPGQSVDVRWDTGWIDRPGDGDEFRLGDPTANEVEIWYANDCSLAIELIAPGEAKSYGPVRPDDPAVSHAFAEGEEALITSDQQTPWEGAARIHINLSPGGENDWIRQGTWIIRLHALEVSARETKNEGVRFDAWIERTIPDPGDDRWQLWSRFLDYDRTTAITLTTPGTSHRAITVGSCSMDPAPEASDFSSCGPTRDRRNKPEVAAPGEWITSSAARGSGDPNPNRTQKYGTSMSAPHVAGVIARLLSRHNYLHADEIRDLLADSATPARGQRGWTRDLGGGKVNATAALRLLEERLRR